VAAAHALSMPRARARAAAKSPNQQLFATSPAHATCPNLKRGTLETRLNEVDSVALTMLVVDDNDNLRNAMSRLLARHGFDVTTANTVSEARLLTRAFDFGVIDITLPDGDGIAVAEELMRDGALQKVVFFTEAGEDARARASGPVVSKSDGIRALTETLIWLVARRSAGAHRLS
jgi:CheY-like chemotaxis protein